MTAQLALVLNRRAPPKREALRSLLADGLRHSQRELRSAGGWRYGARILELRQGIGGPPLDIREECVGGDGSEFVYWCAGELSEPHKPKSWKARALAAEAEAASLRARLAAVSP